MLDFKDIEHFAPYIQLFAGFNVAYILANFFETIRKNFTTAYKNLDVTNKELDDALTADLTSFDSMSISNISNSEQMITKLKKETVSLKNEWEKIQKEILEEFENKHKEYDFRDIFLSVSFFCITELILSGSCAINNNLSLFHSFFVLIYTLALIMGVSMKLSCKYKIPLNHNIIAFVGCLAIAFVGWLAIPLVATITGVYIEIPSIFPIVLTLIIPISPILLLYATFEIEEIKTQRKAKEKANEILLKRKDLLKKKQSIESANAYSIDSAVYN